MGTRAGYIIPKRCLVTGGSGFVGQRLVEMLVERGAEHVVSFDIAPPPKDASNDARIEYIQGDITNKDDVLAVCGGVDCVFHIAALVGYARCARRLAYEHVDSHVYT
jgi:nucleoside-diphosphate-sugar epimerase